MPDQPIIRHSPDDLRKRFRALHRHGLFLMPNGWDIGFARLLASFGFAAIATTSSGHAASLGRSDQQVTLAMRQGPAVPELAAMGVRRVSTRGGLARAAYGALATAARELRAAGISTYLDAAIPGADLEATFDSDRSSP